MSRGVNYNGLDEKVQFNLYIHYIYYSIYYKTLYYQLSTLLKFNTLFI